MIVNKLKIHLKNFLLFDYKKTTLGSLGRAENRIEIGQNNL